MFYRHGGLWVIFGSRSPDPEGIQHRDRYLLTHRLGQILVSNYYTVSPPVAEFLSNHKSLGGVFRIAFYPIVGFSYAFVQHPWGTILVGFGLFLLFGVIVGKKRSKKRS